MLAEERFELRPCRAHVRTLARAIQIRQTFLITAKRSQEKKSAPRLDLLCRLRRPR